LPLQHAAIPGRNLLGELVGNCEFEFLNVLIRYFLLEVQQLFFNLQLSYGNSDNQPILSSEEI